MREGERKRYLLNGEVPLVILFGSFDDTEVSEI